MLEEIRIEVSKTKLSREIVKYKGKFTLSSEAEIDIKHNDTSEEEIKKIVAESIYSELRKNIVNEIEKAETTIQNILLQAGCKETQHKMSKEVFEKLVEKIDIGYKIVEKD